MENLEESVAELQHHLLRLEPDRYSTPFANDVYEAVEYWRDLGQWILEKNTKINYPARAIEEQLLLERLKGMLVARSRDEQLRYEPIFEVADRVLRAAAATLPPKDGHMGILRIIRTNFSFLQTYYGFVVADQQPLGMRYSSGSVWIDLEFAERTNLCCTFGPVVKGEGVFWPEDLLFVYGDQRYQEVQQERLLKDISELEAWLKFLAEVWKTYGEEVLTNRPGIFQRLSVAQERRGAELAAVMNAKYGEG